MSRHMVKNALFAFIALAASHAHAIDFGGLINKELGNLGKPITQKSEPAVSSNTPAITGATKSASNLASFRTMIRSPA